MRRTTASGVSRIRDESGAQMVEFALIIIPLTLLVLGIVNFGYLFGQYLSLNQSAREGARKAVVSTTADEPTVTSFVQASTGGLIKPTTAVTVATAIQADSGGGDFTRSGKTCKDYVYTDGLGGQLQVTANYQSVWLLPLPIPLPAPNLKAEAVFRCEVIGPKP